MESQKIKIELNVNQLNIVLGALAKQPLETVFDVFSTIRTQAEQQVSQPAPQGPLSDKVVQ